MVQYSTVKYSTVQYSTVQYSTVQLEIEMVEENEEEDEAVCGRVVVHFHVIKSEAIT